MYKGKEEGHFFLTSWNKIWFRLHKYRPVCSVLPKSDLSILLFVIYYVTTSDQKGREEKTKMWAHPLETSRSFDCKKWYITLCKHVPCIHSISHPVLTSLHLPTSVGISRASGKKIWYYGIRVKTEQNLASFTCLSKASIPFSAAAHSPPFLWCGFLEELMPEAGLEEKRREGSRGVLCGCHSHFWKSRAELTGTEVGNHRSQLTAPYRGKAVSQDKAKCLPFLMFSEVAMPCWEEEVRRIWFHNTHLLCLLAIEPLKKTIFISMHDTLLFAG